MINLKLTTSEINLLQKALIDYVITSTSLLRHEKDLYWNTIEYICRSSSFTSKSINRLYRALTVYIAKYVHEDTSAMQQLSQKLLIYINEV